MDCPIGNEFASSRQRATSAPHDDLHFLYMEAFEPTDWAQRNAARRQIEDTPRLRVDEMMMHIEPWIENGVAFLDDELSEKTLLHKQVQCVVHRRARDHRNATPLFRHLREDFIRRRVVLGEQDVFADREALGRRLDPRRREPLFEREIGGRVAPHSFRLYLSLETVYTRMNSNFSVSCLG